jgi:hypothetical protein
MTTRNFRVHNGISVGDIVINASTNKITGGSTAAPSADGDFANKKYVDDGLAGLSQNAISQLNTSITVTDSGSNGTITVAADGNTELVINDTAATFSGNVVVTGNMTVNGTTTTVASTNTTHADPLIELNTGAGSNANDLGFVFERGSTGNNAAIIWDESADKFTMGTTTATGSSTGNMSVTTGTLVANLEGNVTGNVAGNVTGNTSGTAATVTTAAQTAITSVGTLTALQVDNLNVNGNTITASSGALNLTPAGGSAIVLDGTINVDAGVVTGATSITSTAFVGNLTGTATAAQYSDVAERFASDTAYTPGTVVALGGAEEITQVNEEGSDEVFGVISSLDQAAFKMNGGAGNDDTHPYIAMTGRVDVKVIGSVNKGDRLISASVPGYAKAATKAECTAFNVIGRALTGKTEAGQGSVLAAVRVSH